MFDQFKQQKLKLLSRFHEALNITRDVGDKEIENRLEVVIDRLQNHVFSIAIAGEFSTGKSTLINALLGVEILPTALKACTAVVTRVRAVQANEVPSIHILYRKSGRRSASPKELGNILTFDALNQDDQPLEAEILVEKGTILDRGIEIVDTPGVNDPEAHGEQVTLSYLPRADAIIYLTHAARSFKASEIDFIKDRIAPEDSQRVIFAVNACDLIEDDDDWDDLRERAQSILPSRFERNPRLFVSAFKALKDKKAGVRSSSELASLEMELTQLVLRERGEKELLRYEELLQVLLLQLNKKLTTQLKDITLDQNLIDLKIKRLREAIDHLEKEMGKASNILQESYAAFDQQMSGAITKTLSDLKVGLDTLSTKTKGQQEGNNIKSKAELYVSDHMKRSLTILQSELRSRQDQISKRLTQTLQGALGEADLLIEPSESTALMSLRHVEFRDLVVVNSRQVQEDVEVREDVPFKVTDESVLLGGIGAMIGAALLGPLGFWAGMMIGGGAGSMGSNYRTVTRRVQEFFTVQSVDTGKIVDTCRERLYHTKTLALRQLEEQTTLDMHKIFEGKIADYRNLINQLNAPTRDEIEKQARRHELEAHLRNLNVLLPQSSRT